MINNTVLQIRVFQLTGNYKTEAKASGSGRRHVENQLGISGSTGKQWMGVEVKPERYFLLCASDNIVKNSTKEVFHEL